MAVDVPEMRPVVELIESPDGSPVAVNENGVPETATWKLKAPLCVTLVLALLVKAGADKLMY